MDRDYTQPEPTRAEVDATAGPLVLEFGTGWCGFCQAAQPHIEAALQAFPGVVHRKVEDGPGRPLGRSFRVKLWPTLVFLRDGQVLAQAARPGADDIRQGLEAITAGRIRVAATRQRSAGTAPGGGPARITVPDPKTLRSGLLSTAPLGLNPAVAPKGRQTIAQGVSPGS